MSTTIELVVPYEVLISIILIYSLFVILLIWYLRKYLKYRRTVYICKRYPIVTLIQVISIISSISINFPVIIFYRCISEKSMTYEYLWNFTIFSQPITVYGALYCLLWRTWHFYYDSMLNIHLDSKWKCIIDPEFESKETENNWYLNNKSSFGSTYFIGKRIFVMYGLSCIISIFVWLIDHYIGYHIALFIDFIAFLLPYILFFVLYRKTPTFGDEMHINDEMKRVNIVIIMSLSCYLLITIISAIVGMHHIFAIIMCFSASFWLFVLAMIHTKWILDHLVIWMKNTLNTIKYISDYSDADHLPSRLKSFYSFMDNTELSKLPKTGRFYSETSSNNATSQQRNKNSNPVNKRNVIETLQNEQTFNAFIIHLNAEYSLECILSFIEIMQFENYLQKNEDKLNKKKEEKPAQDITVMAMDSVDCVVVCNEELIEIEFNDYVPKSQIVYMENYEENKSEDIIIAKQKAYYLYRKYIAEHAEYEINISYGLRARFINIMHDYDLWINAMDTKSGDQNDIDDIIANIDGNKLLSMFNMVTNEMYKLLTFSFCRFQAVLKNNENQQQIHKN